MLLEMPPSILDLCKTRFFTLDAALQATQGASVVHYWIAYNYGGVANPTLAEYKESRAVCLRKIGENDFRFVPENERDRLVIREEFYLP